MERWPRGRSLLDGFARRHGARAIRPRSLRRSCFLLVIIVGGLSGWQSTTESSAPSAVAVADIPSNYLALYEQEAARYGIDWAVLAAIGKVECDHGRSQAAGCNPPGTVNEAGATGPMQFIGSTWLAGTPPMTVPAIGPPTTSTSDGYATDGDGDGLANVWDPADAIAGAARLLRANGAPADYRKAIYAYNHDQAYVQAVLAQASEYRADFAPGASAGIRAVLDWAVAHVGRFTYNLGPPTDRGGSVADMQSSGARGHDLRLLDVHPLGVRAGGHRHRADDVDAVDCERSSSARADRATDPGCHARSWARPSARRLPARATSSSSGWMTARTGTLRCGSAAR